MHPSSSRSTAELLLETANYFAILPYVSGHHSLRNNSLAVSRLLLSLSMCDVQSCYRPPGGHAAPQVGQQPVESINQISTNYIFPVAKAVRIWFWSEYLSTSCQQDPEYYNAYSCKDDAHCVPETRPPSTEKKWGIHLLRDLTSKIEIGQLKSQVWLGILKARWSSPCKDVCPCARKQPPTVVFSLISLQFISKYRRRTSLLFRARYLQRILQLRKSLITFKCDAVQNLNIEARSTKQWSISFYSRTI